LSRHVPSFCVDIHGGLSETHPLASVEDRPGTTGELYGREVVVKAALDHIYVGEKELQLRVVGSGKQTLHEGKVACFQPVWLVR